VAEEEVVTTVQEEQVVVFQLAGESYGIDIAKVQALNTMLPITKVPRTADFIEGVINLRGNITPVVNLHTRFGLPESEFTKDTRIVVVNMDEEGVGLIVDSVSEVMRIRVDAVEEASDLVAAIDSDFIRGIAKVGDERLVILLDLDAMLSATREMSLSDRMK